MSQLAELAAEELTATERSGATPVARSTFERGAWEAPLLTALYVLAGLLVGFAVAGPRLLSRRLSRHARHRESRSKQSDLVLLWGGDRPG